MRRAGRRLLLAWFFAALPGNVSAEETLDEATGLVVDQHLELVRANCTGCHSAGLIQRARLSREDWLDTLRWMQRTQNLWPFPPATENLLLDYLTEHYGPREEAARRRPLARHLRPPNADALTPHR